MLGTTHKQGSPDLARVTGQTTPEVLDRIAPWLRSGCVCQLSYSRIEPLQHVDFLVSATVTEHRVSTLNLDLATPNFAKHPQNQPLYHRIVCATSQCYQQCYQQAYPKNQPQDTIDPLHYPTTVSNHFPQTSRTNHCNNSALHPMHREPPRRHTRLDNGEQS